MDKKLNSRIETALDDLRDIDKLLDDILSNPKTHSFTNRYAIKTLKSGVEFLSVNLPLLKNK